jgi:DNA repair protein RecO (recombination protein O)
MAPPRLSRVEAIVLKDREVGEADRLVCLFTRERGKIWARAAGARRPGSRLGGHVQPLTHTHVLLAGGQSGDVVSQAEVIHPFPALRGDLERLAQALACVEVLDGLTAEGQPNPRAFHLLLRTLEALEAGEGRLPLLWYQVQVLASLGLQPQLFRCAECGTPLTPQPHRYSLRGGGVLCPACAPKDSASFPLSLEALKVLRWLARHDYSRARSLRLGDVGDEVERLLRATLRWHLEREVRAEVFRQEVALRR